MVSLLGGTTPPLQAFIEREFRLGVSGQVSFDRVGVLSTYLLVQLVADKPCICIGSHQKLQVERQVIVAYFGWMGYANRT
jgi:hypothetical protein